MLRFLKCRESYVNLQYLKALILGNTIGDAIIAQTEDNRIFTVEVYESKEQAQRALDMLMQEMTSNPEQRLFEAVMPEELDAKMTAPEDCKNDNLIQWISENIH